jgi:ribonuclease-3
MRYLLYPCQVLRFLDKKWGKNYAENGMGITPEGSCSLASGDWSALQKHIGIEFKNLSLLQQVFLHRSYINERPETACASNERLEFLGDALLNFVIAERLYVELPNLSEGEMTRLRAALVRKDTLSRIAASLQLGDYLFLGKGEEKSGGRQRQSNLARTLEALIGAVFIDQGFASSKDFVWKLFNGEFARVKRGEGIMDYKSQLQELIQAKQHITPSYMTVETRGPNHDKEFVIEVLIGDTPAGRGRGRSKQLAEEEAARQALKRLLNLRY